MALFVGLVSMLWFVVASLLEENVPTLNPGEYVFDYVVGKNNGQNCYNLSRVTFILLQLGPELVGLW